MDNWADDTMIATTMTSQATEKLVALMRVIDSHSVMSSLESLRTTILKVLFLENEDGRG